MADHTLPHNHGEHLNTELLIDNIAKTEDFQIVADLFKVLGDNEQGTHFLASLPLRRMCDQHFFHDGHE